LQHRRQVVGTPVLLVIVRLKVLHEYARPIRGQLAGNGVADPIATAHTGDDRDSAAQGMTFSLSCLRRVIVHGT